MDIRELLLEDNPNDRRRIPTSSGWFTLWLEFEHWVPEPTDDPYVEFFNAIVKTQDGRSCALNVWTYQFPAKAVEEARSDGENLSGKYLLPPDLLVEKADRAVMEEVIHDMLEQGLLEEQLDREQLGFPVTFQMSTDLSPDQQNALILRFREEALARQGLDSSGVRCPGFIWDCFVRPTAECRDATQEEQQKVTRWLASNSDIVKYEVGPISDEWRQWPGDDTGSTAAITADEGPGHGCPER